VEQHSSSRPRRAIIVEDESKIALDLQDAMSEMGFNRCDLASSDKKARSLGMWVQPDVPWWTFVSMEAAKGSRRQDGCEKSARCRLFSSRVTPIQTLWSA
jgi:hypothetical protein